MAIAKLKRTDDDLLAVANDGHFRSPRVAARPAAMQSASRDETGGSSFQGRWLRLWPRACRICYNVAGAVSTNVRRVG